MKLDVGARYRLMFSDATKPGQQEVEGDVIEEVTETYPVQDWGYRIDAGGPFKVFVVARRIISAQRIG